MRWVPMTILTLALGAWAARASEAGQYRLAVRGETLLLNDQPFKVIGLRASNALISEQTSRQLIEQLDVFKSHGVNTISVFVMGSRFGDVKGYRPDSTLDPAYAARLDRIIDAADRRGMVVLVGCLYWSTSTASADLRKWTQKDADAAIANTVNWLSRKNHRNVFVDVDNEGMAHAATKWDLGEMIDAAHAVDRTIPVAYNARAHPPANADILVHFSPRVKGKPWLESEGTPGNAPGGYWGSYSKQKDYYNYIRIGRYTPEMKQRQITDTFAAIDRSAGYMMASTWLQCVAAEGVGGPFMTPGGRAENPEIEKDVTRLQPDAGILWWLEAVKARYGPWMPPPPADASR